MNRRIAGVIFAIAAGSARAQPGTTIQTETRMVLVDVTVTDKKGNPVSGLTQKDFRVWEDNKEQVISSFSVETAATVKAGAPGRYLILFFDDTTMGLSDWARVREAAAGLIQANSASNGLTALVNFSGTPQIVQNFTGDTDRLNGAVASLNFAPAGATPSSGAPTFDANAFRASSVTQPFQDSAAPTLTFSANTFGNRDLLLALRSLAANLNTIPGKKSLVLFTGGIPATSTLLPEVKVALDACNRSNVALYPVDLRGLDEASARGRGRRNPAEGAANAAALSSPVDDQFSAARPPWRAAAQPSKDAALTNRQIMDMLADGTGGAVIASANDPVAGLARIAREQSEYYLLGYTPPSSQGCHTLRAKVERSGLLVRARTGYCDAKPGNLLAGKPIEKELEARASGTQSGNWSASMQAPFFYISPNLARVNLALDMDGNPLQFQMQNKRMHAAVNLLGLATTPDGSTVARFSDTLEINLADGKEIEKFRLKPLHYETQFEITPGQYTLTLAFTSAGEAFGKLELPLAIENYRDNQFAISSLALSKEVRRTSEAGAEIEAFLLEDRTPLIAKDLQVVPSGSNIFRKGEPAMFYFEIYEPLLATPDPKNPVRVAIVIRILDRATGGAKSDSGLMQLDVSGDAGSPVIPAALKMPVQALAPGRYMLELTAADTASNLAKRTVDFDMK
jgi:VWFA-related protein